jgi:hypothetical protein
MHYFLFNQSIHKYHALSKLLEAEKPFTNKHNTCSAKSAVRVFIVARKLLVLQPAKVSAVLVKSDMHWPADERNGNKYI